MSNYIIIFTKRNYAATQNCKVPSDLFHVRFNIVVNSLINQCETTKNIHSETKNGRWKEMREERKKEDKDKVQSRKKGRETKEI